MYKRMPVRHTHTPCVGGGTVRGVLLHMHAKETHIRAINLLKRKHGLGSVGDLQGKLPSILLPHVQLGLNDLAAAGDHTDGNLSSS